MHRTSTLLIAGLLVGCDGATDAHDSGIDQIEYDVMSAAISALLAKEPFARTPGVGEERRPIERVVIIAQPNHEVPATLGPLQADDGSAADPSTLTDYARKSERPAFERRFGGIGPYELLPFDEMQTIFRAGTWTDFYRRFPESPGFFALSRVGVSGDQREAVLFLLHIRGGTWGHESAMLFRKQGESWIHAGTEMYSQF